MTQWTPKLEKLIRQLGEFEERQIKATINPHRPAAVTMAGIIFNGLAKGQRLTHAISQEMGLSPLGRNSSRSDLAAQKQQMIALAEANGSDAADKLKKALFFEEKVRKDYAGQGPISSLKAIKRAHLQY